MKAFRSKYSFDDFEVGQEYVVIDCAYDPHNDTVNLIGKVCTAVFCDTSDLSIGLAFKDDIGGSDLYASDGCHCCESGHGLWFWPEDEGWFQIERLEENVPSTYDTTDLQKLFD